MLRSAGVRLPLLGGKSGVKVVFEGRVAGKSGVLGVWAGYGRGDAYAVKRIKRGGGVAVWVARFRPCWATLSLN